MDMDEVVRLGARETAAGHPFTDPAGTVADLAIIRVMAAGLRHVLGRPLPAAPRPLSCQAPAAAAGRQHRAIVCDDRRLRAGDDVAFVGFFAVKRPGVDATPLTAADDELILEFPRHPGILTYSSLELPDGNWGNLILVDSPGARDHWRTSEKHAWAVRELAPRHYAVVRLHTGVFPGGLGAGGDPVLHRTRYLDFQGAAPWQGERILDPAAP